MKRILLFIIVCTGLSGMAQIPDSPIVNLSDVIVEVGLSSPNSLSNCFTAAVSGGFDPAYSKPGDWLSEFRNYTGSFNIENSVLDSIFQLKDGSAVVHEANGISFNTDGTKIFSANGSEDIMFQFTLSTPYAVESYIPGSYVSKSIAASTLDPNSSRLSADGTKMYLSPLAQVNKVDTWTLSTPFDVSTATFTSRTTMPSTTGSDAIVGLDITSDGLIFTIGTSTGIFKYNLSSANNLSTATFDSKFDNGGYVFGVSWSSDGKNLIYFRDQFNTILHQERFSTAYDFSSNFGITRTFDVEPPTAVQTSVNLINNFKFIMDDTSTDELIIFNL